VKRAPPREFVELRRQRWAEAEKAKKAQAVAKAREATEKNTIRSSPDAEEADE
jgi:hypothetical protein